VAASSKYPSPEIERRRMVNQGRRLQQERCEPQIVDPRHPNLDPVRYGSAIAYLLPRKGIAYAGDARYSSLEQLRQRLNFINAARQIVQLLPLHLLNRGDLAEIDQLVGQAEDVLRLEELGLRSGVRIEMLQPGSPCVVRVAGDQKMCFRQGDSSGIFVRLGGHP
jgi:Fe2+ transport system protein FeoA